MDGLEDNMMDKVEVGMEGLEDNMMGKTSSMLALTTKTERQNIMDEVVSGHYQVADAPSSPALCTRKIAVSVPWLGLQILAMAVDITLFIYEGVKEKALWGDAELQAWFYLNIFTSATYCLDIALRLFAFGCRLFWRKLKNQADCVLVLSCTCFTLAECSGIQTNGLNHIGSARLARIWMLVRMFRMAAVVAGGTRARTFRHITGENKMRFISAEHDLDLDLTYVTGRLIAMGVPAGGFLVSLYRNPIREVARFFSKFHSDHFLIINLCPELPYDVRAFGVNPRTRQSNVRSFNVQDHTPPLMEDFLSFLETGRTWMREDPKNVIAVHCRGGKGRTGSLCCAWLVYTGEAASAKDALNYFALARTDLRQRCHRVQGVETPSQVRYVEYIAQYIRDSRCYFPQSLVPVVSNQVRLLTLTLEDFFVRAPGDVAAAVHVVQRGEGGGPQDWRWRVVRWSDVVNVSEHGTVTLSLGSTEVTGDVRISLFGRQGLPRDADLVARRSAEEEKAAAAKKHVLAGKEPGCMFYFLFHASFLNEDTLQLGMPVIDKACKDSKRYNVQGRVLLRFDQAQRTDV